MRQSQIKERLGSLSLLQIEKINSLTNSITL